MAKCSQCLHWDACSMLFEIALGRKPTANGNKAEEKCPHFKDKTINTNADRIRAMSDEELAKWLLDVMSHKVACFGEGAFPYTPCRNTEHDCVKCGLQWLKQPAEVE